MPGSRCQLAGDQLDVMHGVVLATVESHRERTPLIVENDRLRAQVRSIALAGLAERVRVLNEPLVTEQAIAKANRKDN